MNGKIVIWLLTTALLSIAPSLEAQRAKKVPRVGFLVAGSPSSYAARIESFRAGLRELGYVEGKNIGIEYRYAERDFDQLAAELIGLKVDVIVTGGTPPARAAKKATGTVPIVMALVGGDPVEGGLVASLARPGGNITGLSSIAPDLSGKRLELIKEVLPRVTSVAILSNPLNPAHLPALKESELAASALGMKVQIMEVQAAKDLDNAFLSRIRERTEGLMLLPDGVFTGERGRIVGLTRKRRLVAMFYDKEFVEIGGLMSYGVSYPALFHRAAYYVDKILKGTKPADLPVEQPMKFELVINLKAAKQIGVTIPQSVLYRADRVIK